MMAENTGVVTFTLEKGQEVRERAGSDVKLSLKSLTKVDAEDTH